MSLQSRVKRLESTVGRNGEPCPGGITLTLTYCPELGEPEPEIPPDAPRCGLCRKPHVMLIREEIVDVPRGNAEK
jgi:hypothetical protein